MNEQQLLIELETLGTVTSCAIIDGTSMYGISIIVTEETQATLDSFDSIVSTHVIPHYPTTVDKKMHGGSIKAVFS